MRFHQFFGSSFDAISKYVASIAHLFHFQDMHWSNGTEKVDGELREREKKKRPRTIKLNINSRNVYIVGGKLLSQKSGNILQYQTI